MKNELKHYGVLGMKWGIRRYQKKDGSLTNLGKKRANKEATIWVERDNIKTVNRRSVAQKTYNDINNYMNRSYQKYLKDNPNHLTKWRNKLLKDNPSMIEDPVRLKHNTKEAAHANWEKEFRKSDDYSKFMKNTAKQFVDEFSNATLNDLKIEITPSAKKYVEDVLQLNKEFNWFMPYDERF